MPNSIKTTSSNGTHVRGELTWQWPIGIGALMILFGAIALAAPVPTSISLAWLLGALFLGSGMAQFIHGARFFRERGTVNRFLHAGIALIAGALTLRHPVAGAMGITLIMAFFLMISGVAKAVLASEIFPHTGRAWVYVSAAISACLGAYLLATFPVNSLAVPAIFFGVDAVFFGASFIAGALATRKIEREIADYIERPRKAA